MLPLLQHAVGDPQKAGCGSGGLASGGGGEAARRCLCGAGARRFARSSLSIAGGATGCLRTVGGLSVLTTSAPSKWARRATKSFCIWPICAASPSNRSAQTCAPVSVEMSWALTLTAPATLLALPSSRYRTPSPPPIFLASTGLSLGGGGVAPDDEAILELRNLGREIVGEGVSEILLVRIACQGFKRQDDDGEARRRCELVVKRSA